MSTQISRQVAVYKTDKKLIEIIDKLSVAPYTLYGHLHAQGDDVEGMKMYSNFGVVIQDYSAGKGDSMLRAKANISPDELRYICTRMNACVKTFEFKTDKIFGTPDESGLSTVTKLTIRRAETNQNGEVRRFPWYVEIENGRGKPQKTTTGGTYCASGSFVSDSKLYVNMSDLDFFKLFDKAERFLRVFESTSCAKMYKLAMQKYAEAEADA